MATLINIDALFGTVVGGLIAAGVAWLQSSRERTYRSEEFARLQVAARNTEVRERVDAKAEEILADLDALEKLLLRMRISRYLLPDDRGSRQQVQEAIARISRAALYLQQPLRRRVELAAKVLPDADQLGSQRWVDDSPREIGYFLISETRQAVAQYLRNELISSELTPRLQDYERGWTSLQEMIDHQLEEQLQGPLPEDREVEDSAD